MKKITLKKFITTPALRVKTAHKTLILLSSSLFLSGCISIPFTDFDEAVEHEKLPNDQANNSTRHATFDKYPRALKNTQVENSQGSISKRDTLSPSHPEYVSYSEYRAKHSPVYSKKPSITHTRAALPSTTVNQINSDRSNKVETDKTKQVVDDLNPHYTKLAVNYSKSNYDQLATKYSTSGTHKPIFTQSSSNNQALSTIIATKVPPQIQKTARSNNSVAIAKTTKQSVTKSIPPQSQSKVLLATVKKTIEKKSEIKAVAPSAKTSKLVHHKMTADITSEESHKGDLKQVFQPVIWDQMHNQFHLASESLGEYDSTIRYFKKRPAFLKRVSKRAKPYLHHIFSEVKRRNMPYEIALLPIIESSFRSTARSHQAAGGLWQFIPSTAHLYGLNQNWWFDGRQDALLSTKAALDYLQKLYRLNNNDWLLALASYNGGIGNVKKAIRKYRKKHKNPKSNPGFWDIRPYLLKETRHYVPQLLGVSHVISRAKEFNIPLEPIENSPYFVQVKLKQQVTLAKVAKISGLSVKTLSGLNSGYLRPTTPPKGPYNLILPIKNANRLEEAISRNSNLFDIQWIKHVIQPGESLSVIASNYTATSNAIKEVNGMRNNKIRAGKTLLIPIPKEYASKLKSFTNKKRYTGPKKIHRVKAGDSIWSIARYYNVDTRTLCTWNRIGIRSPLQKGQKLEIRSDKYGYTVEVAIKKGESLWTLAKRYDVSTTELFRWNKIKKSKSIAPGTLLTIWQPNSNANSQLSASRSHRQYKVQKGDNLWNIARANQVTAKLLARYNNLSLEGALHPGQLLKIPFKS
ncbi:MAG: membrane-bound lytic murein transglycosylase D [Thiomicrorhabdus sp.]|nr:MAG: membrane-bound lytic murein transglycosylase D [Thiomicrorhabdus sp.]